jgi:hypothetical protein
MKKSSVWIKTVIRISCGAGIPRTQERDILFNRSIARYETEFKKKKNSLKQKKARTVAN